MMENNEENKKLVPRALLIFNVALVVGIIVVTFGIYSAVTSYKIEKAEKLEEIIAKNPFNQVKLQAKSAYVFDINQDKVLFQKNEFAQLPLASITKLMTALVASELASLDSKITIQKEFLEPEGDSGVLVGESWKLKDLLDFSLLVSSNDGVRSIASVVGAMNIHSNDYVLGRQNFITKMNMKAKEIGLKQTYFINESGLDEGNTSGGYGSAIDVAKLMQYILENNPKLLEATRYESMTVSSANKQHIAKNTNIDIHSIPGLLASKTGFTDMAGGNLVIAFDASIGRPMIVVVLGSTEEGRFSDVSALVKASLETLKNPAI
jgi:D-alanyl-D-alanine carboxypeptidase (penicillin-binding protein 5/6)